MRKKKENEKRRSSDRNHIFKCRHAQSDALRTVTLGKPITREEKSTWAFRKTENCNLLWGTAPLRKNKRLETSRNAQGVETRGGERAEKTTGLKTPIHHTRLPQGGKKWSKKKNQPPKEKKTE